MRINRNYYASSIFFKPFLSPYSTPFSPGMAYSCSRFAIINISNLILIVMKKLLKSLSIAILLLSFLTGFSLGQDKSDLHSSRNIVLQSESVEQNVLLDIPEICTSLNLSISGTIQEGELTIEMYDPKGEKYGNFSIRCRPDNKGADKGKIQSVYLNNSNSKDASSSSSSSLSTSSSASSSSSSGSPSSSTSSSITSSSSGAQGLITKSVKNPKMGTWIVKIIPKNAKGEVKIDYEIK